MEINFVSVIFSALAASLSGLALFAINSLDKRVGSIEEYLRRGE